MRAFVTDRQRALDERAREWAGQRDAREGLAVPSSPWDLADRGWCCVGSVVDATDIGLAVVAVARGVSIVVLCVDEDLCDWLLDDLARVGEVDTLLLGPDPLDVLDDEARALIDHLASGASIGEAAAALFLSPRTAERRVASIRKVMGVRTTAEVVALVSGGPR